MIAGSAAPLAGQSEPAAERSSRARSTRSEGLRVFISYSRDDLDFAEQLAVALNLCGFTCSLDRHGISGGEDWRSRLGALITEADTVVFVLSPASVASDICGWEVSQAQQLGKRILPVINRALDGAAPPPALEALNYVFFYPEPKAAGSGFGAGLAELVDALDTDFEWLREHTRYQQRAMEWDTGGRATNRLLSGRDIDDAKAWIARQPKGAAVVTHLQRDFLAASEKEERLRSDEQRQQVEAMAAANAERQKALHKAEDALKQAADHQRQRLRLRNAGLLVVSVMAIVAGLLAKRAQDQRLVADAQRTIAEDSHRIAETEKANALEQRKVAEKRLKSAEAILRAATRMIVKLSDDLDVDDQATATLVYKHGAELGFPVAMNNLGVQYARGRGRLKQDFTKAREWYEKGAALNDPKSLENLAGLYMVGRGVERDVDKARQLLEKAAERGFPSAMIHVAQFHADGTGAPRDYELARSWLERAVAKEHAPAMMELGRYYEQGLGVPRDINKAIEWYEKAAGKGANRALNHLGVLYGRGEGLTQDLDKARKLFERADDLGVAEATTNLALMYHKGQSVPKDLGRA